MSFASAQRVIGKYLPVAQVVEMSLEQLTRAFQEIPVDMVLCEVEEVAQVFLEALTRIRKKHPQTCLMVFAHDRNPESGKLLYEAGSDLVWTAAGFPFEALPFLVQRIQQNHRLEMENRQLSRAADVLEKTMNATMDAVVVLDDRQRVVWFNQAAEDMFLCSAAGVRGQSLERFLPFALQGLSLKRAAEFTRNDNARQHFGWPANELIAFRANGEAFPIEAKVTIHQTGERSFFSVVMRDVSERQAQQNRFLQVQKMEILGRFSGSVAHDYNNLLTVMRGYCDMLLRELGTGTSPHLKVEAIKKVVSRASELTRQLLIFSRKDENKTEVFSIASLINDLEPLLTRLIGEDILLTIQHEIPTRNIKSNPIQMQQIVMNLVVNARDAMPEGGSLQVQTAARHLNQPPEHTFGSFAPGDYVCISVQDTGVGLDPETIKKMFQPFFTTKGPEKGTGLGLSTVLQIVEMYNGFVAVRSVIGQGTTFTVYLPGSAEAQLNHFETLPTSHESEEIPACREIILLVEDENTVREMTAETLRNQGFTVYEAASGNEALLLVEREKPDLDLVLTDRVMPGINGLELAEQLFRIYPHMKVFLMSGYLEPDDKSHPLASQITYLEKPFSMSYLVKTIRRVLDEPGATA
ncbi:MAG: response regulator [Blastocatellia bacterium]|nr:response regulator [Blastocatellia bacterium]